MSIDELIAQAVRQEVAKQLAELQATATAEHITVATAARMADASAHTVRRWIREGLIHATGEGKRLRVLRGSLDAFLAAPRRRAAPRDLSPESLADAHAGGAG